MSSVSVLYDSHGSLLVCGPARRVRKAVTALPAVVKALLVPSDAGDVAIPRGVRAELVQAEVIQLKGHLGCFRAHIAGPEGLLDLGPLSPNRNGLFDLVLDLNDEPLNGLEVPPLGYAHCTGDAGAIENALETLGKLVGPINKPRYFTFDAELCAHDHQGRHGCRRCLSSCPAGAIASHGGEIEIDPYLCRGCGSCTLACPTGAVRYARPRPRATLEKVAQSLQTTLHEGHCDPVVIFHAGKALEVDLPPEVLLIPVPAIGSVGPEIWWATLALGASRVVIVRSGHLPPTTERLLNEQVELNRRLLQAIGEAPERIRFTEACQGGDWGGLPKHWPNLSVDTLADSGKRELLLSGLRHLARHAHPKTRLLPLKPGDAFGSLALNKPACTLCHACVAACPTRALRNNAGGLDFIERDCVQCGLCVNTCPESALRLIPQFDPDALEKDAVRQLKPPSEMFHCIACGTPFAPVSLVEGSMRHVENHPMFQGDGANLLKMCMSCRQKSTVGML